MAKAIMSKATRKNTRRLAHELHTLSHGQSVPDKFNDSYWDNYESIVPVERTRYDLID